MSETRKKKQKNASGKQRKSSKDSKKSKSSKGSHKSKSKRITSQKSMKSAKTAKFPPPPDPAFWMDFKVLEKYIDIFCVFFKPSEFPYRIRISDLEPVKYKQQGTKNKTKSTEEKTQTEPVIYVKYTKELKKSRNEPLYFFCDTLETKFLHINLIQAGCVELLKKVNVENMEEEYNIESEYLCNIRTCPAYAYLAEEDLATTQKLSTKVPITQYNFITYNWQVNTFGDKIVGDTTLGRSGLIHELGAGRQVCQIYVRSEETYIIDILSDSPIIVGSLELINEHMAQESELFTEMCYNVASSFGKLIQKFGTDEYIDGIRHFFSCLKYNTTLKKESKIIQEAFIHELLHMIQDIYSVDKWSPILRAIKVLFLDPALQLDIDARRRSSFIPKTLDICLCEVNSLDEIRINKQKERAAVTIQAVYRSYFVRKLIRLHKQEEENHLPIFATLKDVYDTIFSVSNRLIYGSALLRKLILKNSKMEKLRRSYNFYKDLENVINLLSFTGHIQTYINSWVFIARYTFECDSKYPVIVKICLFCDLPRYVVRVFDNDTEEEIERYTHTVSVWAYKPNINGYTVVCYGWSEIEKNIAWKLSFITKKIGKNSLIEVSDKTILLQHLNDIYIPNVHNRIFRCIAKIHKNSLATFRLSLSFSDVKVLFRCSREDGKKFVEIRGKGNLILPIVSLRYFDDHSQSNILQFSDKSKSILKAQSSCRLLSKVLSFFEKESNMSLTSKLSTKSVKCTDTYILEAFVLENSWPLTKTEWETVELYEESKLYANVIQEGKSVQNLGKASIKLPEPSENKKCVYFGNLKKPYWTLQTICDKIDMIIVKKDTSRENKILNIKKSWYKNDPLRYEKSKQQREKFLDENYTCLRTTNVDKVHIRASTAALVTADELNLIPTRVLRNEVQLIEDINSSPLMQTINNRIVFLVEDKAPRFDQKLPDIFKLLPNLELEKYYKPSKIPYNENNTILFTDELMEKFQADREANIIEYEGMLARYLNNIVEIIIDQNEHKLLLNNWYVECKEESNRLLKEVFANREKYMENLKQSQKSQNPSESNSRAKKRKK